MSIPKWEMNNLTQGEFPAWKWVKGDHSADGLYGQKIHISFIERLLTAADRAADKREAKRLEDEQQIIYDEKLTERPPTPEQIEACSRKRRRRRELLFKTGLLPIFNPFSRRDPKTKEPLYRWEEPEEIS